MYVSNRGKRLLVSSRLISLCPASEASIIFSNRDFHIVMMSSQEQWEGFLGLEAHRLPRSFSGTVPLVSLSANTSCPHPLPSSMLNLSPSLLSFYLYFTIPLPLRCSPLRGPFLMSWLPHVLQVKHPEQRFKARIHTWGITCHGSF